MAENKKSFVLYSDLIHTVRKMPKDKAGELFMVILEYVNDENPTVTDLLVDLVFEPVKQSLKRDLCKYEDKKIKFSEAGKRSAEARKLAKIQEENKTKSTKSTNVENVEKKVTFSTVSVNDNVSVNVNDILLEKETKLEKEKISRNESFGLEILESQTWIETISMQNKITPDKIPKWIDEFNKKLISELDTKISKKEYASHFSRWLPGEILKSKKIIEPTSTPNQRKQF